MIRAETIVELQQERGHASRWRTSGPCAACAISRRRKNHVGFRISQIKAGYSYSKPETYNPQFSGEGGLCASVTAPGPEQAAKKCKADHALLERGRQDVIVRQRASKALPTLFGPESVQPKQRPDGNRNAFASKQPRKDPAEKFPAVLSRCRGVRERTLCEFARHRSQGFRRRSRGNEEKSATRTNILSEETASSDALSTARGSRDTMFLFVCVARIAPQKNHALLLKAFAQVPLPIQTRIWSWWRGSLAGQLEQQAKNLGVAGQAHFSGLRARYSGRVGRDGCFRAELRLRGQSALVMRPWPPVCYREHGFSGVPNLIEMERKVLSCSREMFRVFPTHGISLTKSRS